MSKPGASEKKKAARGQWHHVDGGSAFILPYTVLRHDNLKRLSPQACKLLLDISRQYSGFNNGYLSAAWKLMQDMGWRSPETVDKAELELLHYKLIEQTRQGSRNRCTLYALTWWPIQEKQDDPLERPSTTQPSAIWKERQPDFVTPNRFLKKAQKLKLVPSSRAA